MTEVTGGDTIVAVMMVVFKLLLQIMVSSALDEECSVHEEMEISFTSYGFVGWILMNSLY